MMQGLNEPVRTMIRLRKKCLGGASVILALLGLTLGTGCNEEEALTTFRNAASDSVLEGLKTISNGFFDGLFAVIEAGNDGTADTTTTE